MRRAAFLLVSVLIGTFTVASCAADDSDAFSTLPPIRTTTTTSTTTTTISDERQWYVIKPGETLSVIAEKLNVTIRAIVELNNISNPDTIAAGDTIEVPRIFDIPDPGPDDDDSEDDDGA